ncbi:MAG: MFS transporter [Thermoplasmata archaeon]|nr:MFS transporter [Thermoplasmata archaeon]
MTGAPDQAPPSGRLLSAVFGATFLVRFGFGLTVSIFATYLAGRSQGLETPTFGLIGLVSAMAPIGEFSTVLISGAAADRYGRVQILVGASALAALLMALVATTRLPIVLGALNLLFGVASGAILASSLAVVTEESTTGGRGLEMGRFDAVNLLGWILGFAIGYGSLDLLPNAELGVVFAVGAALLGAGALFARISARGVFERRTFDALRFRRVVDAVARRDVLLVTLPWLVIYMLLGTVFVFLGTASSSAGLPSSEIALLIGGGGLLLLLTQPTYGRMADRFGRIRLMWVGTFGFLGVLLGAALLTEYGVSTPALALVGVSALAALAYGPAALAALGDISADVARGTTMAIYSLVISLGMLVGLIASTQLYAAWGNTGLVVFFGGVAVGLFVLTAVRYWDLRRSTARPAA